MLNEIKAAAEWITNHVSSNPDVAQVEAFSSAMESYLASRFDGHWHAHDPEIGSAYRCVVRSAYTEEPTLSYALDKSKWDREDFEQRMGDEKWTLWIDPGCVSVRKGDASILVEIYGTLPAGLKTMHAAVAPLASDEANLSAVFDSPKRSNRAVQIVHPSTIKRESAFGPKVAVEAPTPIRFPLTAASLSHQNRDLLCDDKVVETNDDDVFTRPLSRLSTASSSSIGACSHSSRDSISSATSLFSSGNESGKLTPEPGMMAERRPSHKHTTSTSSVLSTSSAVSNSSNKSSSSSRRQQAVVVQGTVTDYSNGKVGVLGGRVLLGIPKKSPATSDDESSVDTARQSRGRRGTRSRSQNSSVSSMPSHHTRSASSGNWGNLFTSAQTRRVPPPSFIFPPRA